MVSCREGFSLQSMCSTGCNSHLHLPSISEFTGKTFQAAQLTHERFLTRDHSCKNIFFDICQTELKYRNTHQRSVEVQFCRYKKNILQEWSMVKNFSCVSCATWIVFPVNSLLSWTVVGNYACAQFRNFRLKFIFLILSLSTIRYFRVSSWLLSLCHHPTGCLGKICIWITNICMHMRLWSNCTQKSDIDESKRSPTSNGFISRASCINMEALYNSWKPCMKFYSFLDPDGK
jgi:hypothetical protein